MEKNKFHKNWGENDLNNFLSIFRIVFQQCRLYDVAICALPNHTGHTANHNIFIWAKHNSCYMDAKTNAIPIRQHQAKYHSSIQFDRNHLGNMLPIRLKRNDIGRRFRHLVLDVQQTRSAIRYIAHRIQNIDHVSWWNHCIRFNVDHNMSNSTQNIWWQGRTMLL